jgi:PhnB protein
MATINPYVHFNGNAEEAFTFYKSVFGGEFGKIMRYKDLSHAEYPVAENDANRIYAYYFAYRQKPSTNGF